MRNDAYYSSPNENPNIVNIIHHICAPIQFLSCYIDFSYA